MTPARSIQDGTGWPTVFLIVGAGVVSAFQVGKAPMALAAVQAEFALSLPVASWLIAAFAIIGAIAGAPIGLAVDRIGARRMAIFGLLVQGVASALGAMSIDAGTLFATRILEGLGFLSLIVAAPALIAARVPVRNRDRAMALWAIFMPVGMTLVMLAAPLLSLLTWRGFWFLNAAILTGYAMLIVWKSPVPPPNAARPRPIRQEIVEAITAPGPWILAGIFGSFTAIFFAVFGFLPSILSHRFGISAEAANMMSAIAVAASGVGNLVCGQLLARGFRSKRVLLTGFGAIALCAAGIFSEHTAAPIAYAFCILFSFASGMIPVVIFSSAPRYAPKPGLIGITLGFTIQGNNLGLVIGPPATGWVAAAFGWPMVSLLIVVISLFAALLAVALYRLPTPELALL